ncbi:uncharacterized protein BDZ99DRAFT_456952 [Mytilinidion resinicola]|uniref:Uncharacterized protein n=1 Tax=Mytilinidion resinicola TaxID=574789 RepID=A0A6A6ZA80_9PEZI|nr:uncharacterized protein BDZ99DRAFT_456952 [Mytilinidion resinicola]KAF2817194.1 hypothetical protein BDZ99DRAFT_456952 [Mytilinidion resinicola]
MHTRFIGLHTLCYSHSHAFPVDRVGFEDTLRHNYRNHILELSSPICLPAMTCCPGRKTVVATSAAAQHRRRPSQHSCDSSRKPPHNRIQQASERAAFLVETFCHPVALVTH